MSDHELNGRYYARDGMVYKAPLRRKTETGYAISMGFPVCKMHDAAGDDAAETVAALMNLGQENSQEWAS